jgi:hypothetical protein
MNNDIIGIRYTTDGDIEAYDKRTGKTTGHITTMGNFIEETEEDKRRNEEDIKYVMKKYGLTK